MQHLPYYYTAEQLKACAAGGMMAAAAAAASGTAPAGIPGAAHHQSPSTMFTIDSILAPRPYLAAAPQRPTPYFPYNAAALHAQAQHELLGEYYICCVSFKFLRTRSEEQ